MVKSVFAAVLAVTLGMSGQFIVRVPPNGVLFGLLDTTRAINWQRANVGVPGDIPTTYTQCGSTIAAYGSSGTPAAPDTINNAIDACGANQYVLLGAGTFYLNASIEIVGHSNIILRGAGPASTILSFSGAGFGGAFSGSVYVATATQIGPNSASVQPAGINACNWTGGFARGATNITLSNCGSTGILDGDVLILDQQNDMADNGGYMVCDTNGGIGPYSSGDPVTNCKANVSVNGNTGRVINNIPWAQEQFVIVTAGCSSACNSAGPYTLTISPGLYANNWNAHGPGTIGAWFVKPVRSIGIENLTIDDTNCPNDATCQSGLVFFNVYGGWAKNVSILNTRRNHIWLFNSYRAEVRDSYFYGTKNAASSSYGVEFFPAGDSLVENNIFQTITVGVMSGGGAGNVIAYNYQVNALVNPSSFLQGQYPSHSNGNYLNLWEGNVVNSVITDELHGTSGLMTMFRNWINGRDWNTVDAPASHPTSQVFTVSWASYTRGMNVIGNVLGTPGFHNVYERAVPTAIACSDKAIYTFGYANPCGASGGVPDDTLVAPTVMRWGNYDVVNATIRWDASEAEPKAATHINANMLTNPASHVLPSSMYLSAKPAFFSSLAFPPIGPDVTGGNGGFYTGGTYDGGVCQVGATAGGGTCDSLVGGHANVIPAMHCYLNVLAGTPDGSGSPLSFTGCY